MNEIKLFKMNTGEEIIAKVVKQDGDMLTLASPRVLMAQQVQSGQVGIAMIPWLMGAPDMDIQISVEDVVGIPVGDLPKQLSDGYLQQTTGIALAGASGGIKV